MATSTLVRPSPALTRGFARVTPTLGVQSMTLQGTVNKTLFLTLLVVLGGVFGWTTATSIGVLPLYLALIAATIIGLVTCFKPEIASKTAPIYSILQGVFLGAISMLMNETSPGIVLTAVELTVGILVALLGIYSTGIIKVDQRFRIGVAAATFGVLVVFLINMIASLFGSSLGFVSGNSNSMFAIGFTLLVIAIACANLIVDFDFVQRGVAAQFPKNMEWYAAFSIMVTLIWLYLEILRLLGQLRR